MAQPPDRFQQLRDRLQERRDQQQQQQQQQNRTPRSTPQFSGRESFRRNLPSEQSSEPKNTPAVTRQTQERLQGRQFDTDRSKPEITRRTPTPQVERQLPQNLSERLRSRSNQTDDDSDRGQQNRIRLEDSPTRVRGTVPPGPTIESNKESVKSRLEQLRERQSGRRVSPGVATETAKPDTDATEDKTPSSTGRKFDLDALKKQQQERATERKDVRRTPATTEARRPQATPEIAEQADKTPASGQDRRIDLEQLKQQRRDRLQGLKDAKETPSATETPAAGTAGQTDQGRKLDLNALREQRREREETQKQELQEKRDAQNQERKDQLEAQKQQLQEKRDTQNEQRQDRIEAQKQQQQEQRDRLTQQQQDRRTAITQFNEQRKQRFTDKTGKANPLQQVDAREKIALVGANVKPAVDKLGIRDMLSKNDVETRFGDLRGRVKPRYDLNKEQLADLKRGRWDRAGIERPYGDWGRVRKPYYHHDRDRDDITINNINININNFLPPPIYSPARWDYADFRWSYWDGRSHYDHDFAINMFVNLGHTRYGGFDGVMVSGRYWSYGYGWIDGCIDYGYHRIWVPGFWSSYVVEECFPSEMWIPPVYEEVWTGCCWETIQVDGGYFVPTPPECRLVTRWAWVPGHYQFVA